MPLLKITTNVPASNSAPLLKELSAQTAAMLGKPEGYVVVILEPEQAMLFGGEDAPAAYLELKSIGLPESRTGEFSARLCELIGQGLKIPAERIYIEFADAPRHMWGWNSKTF
jgi:phenylpyruvate tautomerase PptA (4-oxalocrotonate tautomerase family)